jgi:hypothetical protein
MWQKESVLMLIWFSMTKNDFGSTYMDVTKQKTTLKQDNCLPKDLLNLGNILPRK